MISSSGRHLKEKAPVTRIAQECLPFCYGLDKNVTSEKKNIDVLKKQESQAREKNQCESKLVEIAGIDEDLKNSFKDKFIVQENLSRTLVSFQANKTRAVYRWYKYKEAFSAALIEYLLERYGIKSGTILDPFAGIGTTMFAASGLGVNADGIELLPIGQQIIQTKQILDTGFSENDFDHLMELSNGQPWRKSKKKRPMVELRITRGAYPPETQESIERYLGICEKENEHIKAVLRFALLCILESVSYTRKDGQYLRWDHRSGRRQGNKPFDKGRILEFDSAISAKIKEITADARNSEIQKGLFSTSVRWGEIRLFTGSCLDIMRSLPENSYDAIVTSPPYCNRYDYTRTYALELAMLGVDESELSRLRQTMISCTVENRTKDLVSINHGWEKAVTAAEKQKLLHSILEYLEEMKINGELNNNGIPRMVRGYFYEMACVITECRRVLNKNAPVFMVNDNVRYAGASISVDMILSDIAEKLGFRIENILVLPNGKGNSSQQMGEHGREPLRKCVYVWRKNNAKK